MVSNRYEIRRELKDGTLEAAYQSISRKDVAIREARRAARDSISLDVARIWVDDSKNEIGIASFPVVMA